MCIFIIMRNIRLREEIAKVGECVHVEIIKKNDLGVTVNILDYPGVSGFVPLNEIIKKKLKSRKDIKEGVVFPAIILSDQGEWILSKRHISEENIPKIEDEYRARLGLRVLGYSLYNLMMIYNQKYNLTSNDPTTIDPINVMKNSVWRLVDELVSDEENEMTKYKESGEIDNKVDLQFYNFVLAHTNLLFNSFFGDKFTPWGSKIFASRVQRSECEISYQFALESTMGINNIKRMFSILQDEFPDIEMFFLSPGQYKFIGKDVDESKIRTRLDSARDKLIELAKQYNMKYCGGTMEIIKPSILNFKIIDDRSNIDTD